jgi:hypothetical protein
MPTDPRLTARVTPIPAHGGVEISVSAGHISPDVRARAAAAGLGAIRASVQAGVRADDTVRRWRALGEQVAAAEAQVRRCAEVEERVRAAQLLLRGNPVEDFAARLREVEAELSAAQAAKRQAVQDLEMLRGVVPGLWAPAATAAASAASNAATRHFLALGAPAEAARRALDDACTRAAEAITDALNRYVVPAAVECLVAAEAYRASMDGADAFTAELLAAAVGPMPPGVTRVARNVYRVEEPPEPPAEPPPPAPPAPMNSYGVRVVPPGPAARGG